MLCEGGQNIKKKIIDYTNYTTTLHTNYTYVITNIN